MKNILASLLLTTTSLTAFANATYTCVARISSDDVIMAEQTLETNENGILAAHVSAADYKVNFSASEVRGALVLSIVDNSENGMVPSRMGSAETVVPSEIRPSTMIDIQLADGAFANLKCAVRQ